MHSPGIKSKYKDDLLCSYCYACCHTWLLRTLSCSCVKTSISVTTPSLYITGSPIACIDIGWLVAPGAHQSIVVWSEMLMVHGGDDLETETPEPVIQKYHLSNTIWIAGQGRVASATPATRTEGAITSSRAVR